MEKDWILRVAVKIVLIMALPYQIYISNDYFNYISIIGTLIQGNEVYDLYGSISFLYFAFFFGILTFPAVIFYYVQYHRPRHVSVNKFLVPVCVFSHPLIQALALTPIMMAIITMGDYYGATNAAMLALSLSPWTLLLLVVAPYFLRELRTKDSMTPKDNIRSRLLGEVSRYSISAFVLAISVVVLPMFFIEFRTWLLQVYPQEYMFISGIGAIGVYFYRTDFSITYTLLGTMYIPGIIVGILLQVVFGKEVLKYLQEKTERLRTIAIGVVTLLIATFLVPFTSFFGYGIVSAYPIPSVLITGTLIMFLVKPMVSDDNLWDEEPHQMWFEPEEPREEGERGAEIKIPIRYLLRSKLSRSKPEKTIYNWDRKNDDVFGGEDGSLD